MIRSDIEPSTYIHDQQHAEILAHEENSVREFIDSPALHEAAEKVVNFYLYSGGLETYKQQAVRDKQIAGKELGGALLLPEGQRDEFFIDAARDFIKTPAGIDFTKKDGFVVDPNISHDTMIEVSEKKIAFNKLLDVRKGHIFPQKKLLSHQDTRYVQVVSGGLPGLGKRN